jgi:membrane associated rhomboid family serine protease
MIPLRDVIPSRTRPFVTVTLILLNAVIFLSSRFAPELDGAVLRDAVAPAASAWTAGLVAMFLHAGWLHLAGNLLVLWLVGGNVEDRMGHGRYLVFYLLVGAAAAFAQIWNTPYSAPPPAGASGAIAGLTGAYLVLFPNSRVLVLVPAWKTLDIIELPALIVLLLWVLIQIAAGFGGGTPANAGAHWMLAGGFAAGLALVWVFRRREREEVEWWSTTNK